MSNNEISEKIYNIAKQTYLDQHVLSSKQMYVYNMKMQITSHPVFLFKYVFNPCCSQLKKVFFANKQLTST